MVQHRCGREPARQRRGVDDIYIEGKPWRKSKPCLEVSLNSNKTRTSRMQNQESQTNTTLKGCGFNNNSSETSIVIS